MSTVLGLLYDDPTEGHPVDYKREAIPRIELYPDGQIPPPARAEIAQGELLGDTTGALGLRQFLAAQGHSYITTSDQDGPHSAFEQALPDADILIAQACWPVALTEQRIARAPRLRLVITAGTGSHHIDLEAAARRGITVAEITWSDSVSAAEYAVMLVLSLVHNAGPWETAAAPRQMADQARRAYDLEGMHVGSIGAGRTGLAFLRRLRPFDVRLHYTDLRRLPSLLENELNLVYHPTAEFMFPCCDVLSVHTRLNRQTAGMIDAPLIDRMKRGTYLVNTVADSICDPAAVAAALKTGRIAGYATDRYQLQSSSSGGARVAGSTLSAQARYAAGTREVLESWFGGSPIRAEYLILDRGQPTALGIRSYGIGQ